MQSRHYNLRGRNLFAVNVHGIDGDAAAVINHGDGIIDVDGDFDFVGVSGEGFVDGVVDYFVYEVVQAQVASGADVHCRALADGFHAAKNFDGIGSVVAVTVRTGFAVLQIGRAHV